MLRNLNDRNYLKMEIFDMDKGTFYEGNWRLFCLDLNLRLC